MKAKKVYTIKYRRSDGVGLEVTLHCNWFGVAVSWGTTFAVASKRPAHYVAAQIGPIIATYSWFFKTPPASVDTDISHSSSDDGLVITASALDI